MLGFSVATRILSFTGAVVMRKGFDGLSATAIAAGEDVYSGRLFVFVSSRRNRERLLAIQTGSLVLWREGVDRAKVQDPPTR